MAISTQIKNLINKGLYQVGLELNTLTRHRRETSRLKSLQDAGYFDVPAFPIPKSFIEVAPDCIFDDLARYSARFEDLSNPSRNCVRFSFDNTFFTSPDAEVLYCMIRRHRPRRIVEIGSGNSTKIARLALRDGKIDAQLTSIDPLPRANIDEFADTIIRDSVESIEDLTLFEELAADDVLFIDSSHELRAGNDITHIYLNILPRIAAGVLVHIHDVFLPYDYPACWLVEQGIAFTEQYLVQSMLNTDEKLEVIWPGYYLQRTVPGFNARFPNIGSRNAQSLWLRKRRSI